MRIAIALALFIACGTPVKVSRVDRGVIVAAERGPQGMRLVGIAENGDVQFALVAPAAARDSHPAISPDGAWVVFASTRERGEGTSLWIVPYGVEGVPVRLTSAGIDSHPTWAPDGRAIVFASTRAGDFDLWRLAIDRGRPVGEPLRLTSAVGHEVMPSVARDGAIVYAAVTIAAAGGSGPRASSRIEERAADGTIRAVTQGPDDRAPAVSPDGTQIVFTRGIARTLGGDVVADAELWRVARRPGAAATQLVELPLTDEGDLAWSADGRFVFASSVLRGVDGRALFSAVVHIDVRDTTPVARMLQDRSGPIPRLTPAIRSRRLDARALRSDPEYLLELSRIMAAAIAAHKQQQQQQEMEGRKSVEDSPRLPDEVPR